MKRDMELIRLLLLQSEADADLPEVRARDLQEVLHHIALLKDASLVEGQVNTTHEGRIHFATIYRLTWQGHEFLDAMRDDNLWKKAKEHVLKPGASWSFELLKEWAKHELKIKLGLPD